VTFVKKVLRIDRQGFFMEDVVLEDGEITPQDCIELECPNGFQKPRWKGRGWVEGLTVQEIEEIKNKPIPKTELEILKETVEELVLSNLLGV